MDYQDKYLKYKNKYYIKLHDHIQNGGAITDEERKKLLKASELLFNYHLFEPDLNDKIIPSNYYRRHIIDLMRLNTKYNTKSFYEYTKNNYFIELGKFVGHMRNEYNVIQGLRFEKKNYTKKDLLNKPEIYEEFY